MFGIIKKVLRDICPSSHRKWEQGTVLPPVTLRGAAQEMPWRHSEWAELCPHGEVTSVCWVECVQTLAHLVLMVV